jgi:hypothetical protein
MNRLDDNQYQTEQNRFLQNFALLDIEDDLRFLNYLNNDIREYLSKRLEVIHNKRYEIILNFCLF